MVDGINMIEGVRLDYFTILLNDLHESRLEWELVPDKYGLDEDGSPVCGCVRAIVNQNPEWYRELCRRYPRHRRRRKARFTDSYVIRRRVIQWLEKLSKGVRPRAGMVDDLIEFALDLQKSWNLSAESLEHYCTYGEMPEPWNDESPPF